MKISHDDEGYRLKIRRDGEWANYDEQNGPFVSLYDLLNYYVCGSKLTDDMRKAFYGDDGAEAPSADESAKANASATAANGGTGTRSQSHRLQLPESGVFLDLLCPFVDVTDPTAARWFHGQMESEKAKELLKGTPLSPSAFAYVRVLCKLRLTLATRTLRAQ